MLEDLVAGEIVATEEFSVTAISNKIKFLLESNFTNIKIRGEISGLKIATSGHGYFSLKDTGAVIAATCWRHSLNRVKFQLTEGLEVVVTGKITAYAGQSKYQISVEAIEPAGLGAFMQILEERKQRLAAEGLFAVEHKKKIPFLPKKIGIITSLTGAVIKDIIHRISDRLPSHLCIWPVSVQGENAATEIVSAIEGFNGLDSQEKPEILIIARGGGSIEDLLPFSEEIVVRAAFASQIPIISAVGHETDYTLLDFVADLRAPTPTAAAEFAVPVRTGLQYTVVSLFNNIYRHVKSKIDHRISLLASYERICQYPINYLNNNVQKLDDLGFRLSAALPNLLRQKQLALSYLPISRFSSKIIHYKTLQLLNCSNNLTAQKAGMFNQYEYKLSISSSLLTSLDYNKVLARGYAMLRDEKGRYIFSVADAQKHQHLQIKLKDGELAVINNQKNQVTG